MNDMRTMTNTYHIAQFTHQCIHITLTDSSTPLTAIHIPATSDTKRGQTIQIFCDPDDPETFYAPNDTTNTILTVVFCGLGGLFATIAIVLIIVLIHIKKKQKSGKIFQKMNYTKKIIIHTTNNSERGGIFMASIMDGEKTISHQNYP